MAFHLTRKYIIGEIEAAKAAIKAHEEGKKIHQIMKKAFERELEKFPEEKDGK